MGYCNMRTSGIKRNSLYSGATFLFIFLLATLSSRPTLAADWKLGEAKKAADSVAQDFHDPVNEAFELKPDAGLKDYLKYAALNNPSLKMAFYNWKAALEKTGYAGALPDPMVSVGYYIKNVETRVGPQEYRLSLKQSFPWFGTLGAQKEVAWQMSNAAYNEYQSEKLRLFYRVKAAYYELYYLGRQIALTRENMDLLSFWETVVSAKYKVALNQHPDVIMAQVELGKLEDMLASLEAMTGPATANLRTVLNLDDKVAIALPAEIDISEQPIDHDSVLARVIDDNPDLMILERLIEKERGEVKLAGKASWPNLTFNVDYIKTGAAANPTMEESGKSPWMVTVGLDLPIWLGKNKAKKQEALALYRSAEYKHKDAQNRATAMTDQLFFEYNDALRKIRLYRDGLIPKAEQSLNANYAAYQTGEADFLSILDAQRLLLDFQLKLEKAMVDLATRQAELEMISGREIGIEGAGN